MNPNEWLEMLSLYADELRKSGVQSVEIGPDSCRFTLAPWVEPVVSISREKLDEALDPLDDPTTFGGRVIGYERLRAARID